MKYGTMHQFKPHHWFTARTRKQYSQKDREEKNLLTQQLSESKHQIGLKYKKTVKSENNIIKLQEYEYSNECIDSVFACITAVHNDI